MSISRRVLFGEIAGVIVAARILPTTLMGADRSHGETKKVLATERTELVEQLMKPITRLDGEERLDDVRFGDYRGYKIRWDGWMGALDGNSYQAKGGWLAWKDGRTFLTQAKSEGLWSDDSYLDLLRARRAALNTVLDLIEANS